MSTDQRIRDAGARLSSVAVNTPDPSRVMRRRTQVRSIAMVGSVALVATVIGVAAWNVRSDDPMTAASPLLEQCSNAATYELLIDGAIARPVEQVTASTADTAVWADATDTRFLTLTVRPGVATTQPTPTGVGPMSQDTTFPKEQGQAWFTTTSTDRTRHVNMWWARTNGDLWLLAEYWYGVDDTAVDAARQSLRERALSIQANENENPYVLADSTMQLVASERAGAVSSRAFVWDYPTDSTTVTITLLVINDAAASGRANVLANGKPEPTIVDGCPAWRTTAANGDVVIGWSTNQNNASATLTIPAALSRSAGAIADSVRRT